MHRQGTAAQPVIEVIDAARHLHPAAFERGAELVVQLDDPGALVHGRLSDHAVRQNGANPTRCHGSVSMWPSAGGDLSAEVKQRKGLEQEHL